MLLQLATTKFCYVTMFEVGGNMCNNAFQLVAQQCCMQVEEKRYPYYRAFSSFIICLLQLLFICSSDSTRNLIEPGVPRYLNSDISWFGVGGKQAIFFIGNATRVCYLVLNSNTMCEHYHLYRFSYPIFSCSIFTIIHFQGIYRYYIYCVHLLFYTMRIFCECVNFL